MQKLIKNAPLIPFCVEDIHGNIVSTEDYAGQKLMISFYRYAECMFCNLRIHQLIQRYEEFQAKGLNIIAFFQSPKEDVLRQMERHNPPFPIIALPDRSIYKEYGVVEHSASGLFRSAFQMKRLVQAISNGFHIRKPGKGNLSLIPADFLVEENQLIYEAFYGNDITDHIPMSSIEAFLEKQAQE